MSQLLIRIQKLTLKVKNKYSLDNSSKKFICPNCNKNRFVRYFDSNENKYLPEQIGRCDREQSCGYHFKPKDFFAKNPLSQKSSNLHSTKFIFKSNSRSKKIDFLNPNYAPMSMKKYDQNNFVIWLKTLFNASIVTEIINDYNIGTSKRWHGATVFFQKDIKQRIRQVKIMLYNTSNGKRVKQDESPNPGRSKILFVGKQILKSAGNLNPNLKQCFFGEHLLINKTKIVGIVESEKTAILLHAYAKKGLAPPYVWLATGGKNGCRWYGDTSTVLKDRDVILFPDLGAYEDWEKKSAEITNCNLVVSDILEEIATKDERKQGLDLADYYLKVSLNQDLTNDAEPENNNSNSEEDMIARMIVTNPLVSEMIMLFKLVPN